MNRKMRRAKEAMLRGPVRRYEETMARATEFGLVVPRLFPEGESFNSKAKPREEMRRRDHLTLEAARIIGSTEMQQWLEVIVMSVIEELQRDPVFIEDLKDILRESSETERAYWQDVNAKADAKSEEVVETVDEDAFGDLLK